MKLISGLCNRLLGIQYLYVRLYDLCVEKKKLKTHNQNFEMIFIAKFSRLHLNRISIIYYFYAHFYY